MTNINRAAHDLAFQIKALSLQFPITQPVVAVVDAVVFAAVRKVDVLAYPSVLSAIAIW